MPQEYLLMKLSIIIVSWNVKKDLLQCLASISQNPPTADYEVIVVDNASRDDTVEIIRKKHSNVHLIANNENLGFAGANNQGFDKAAGEDILFLNPDTIVKPRAFDILIKFMEENPDVGVCGPKLVFEDERIQQTVRRFPTFAGALHRHTIFKATGIFRKAYSKWLMKEFKYDRIEEVDQIMGAALMVRRSILEEVGLMDNKNFFMYYEEVDLCYRIKKAGHRVVFVPEAEIIHLGGRSSGQIPVEKTVMAMTSLLKFFRKHRSRFSSTLFGCLFKSAFVLNEIFRLLIYSIAYTVGCICFSSKFKEHSIEKLKYSAKLLKYSHRPAIRADKKLKQNFT